MNDFFYVPNHRTTETLFERYRNAVPLPRDHTRHRRQFTAIPVGNLKNHRIRKARQAIAPENRNQILFCAEAYDYANSIVKDGTVNIDRGDLSSDIGMLELAESQARIIASCRTKGKYVFLATQCLKNMETLPIPLIPEILDLSSSIQQGISGIQLSEETAVGLYPLECIHLVWQVYQQFENRQPAL